MDETLFDDLTSQVVEGDANVPAHHIEVREDRPCAAATEPVSTEGDRHWLQERPPLFFGDGARERQCFTFCQGCVAGKLFGGELERWTVRRKPATAIVPIAVPSATSSDTVTYP